jgi:hypothetical protein
MGGGGGIQVNNGAITGPAQRAELARRRKEEADALRMPAEARTPTLSDQAIRDAILAERARLLTGNSRRQAFIVGGTGRSTLGR